MLRVAVLEIFLYICQDGCIIEYKHLKQGPEGLVPLRGFWFRGPTMFIDWGFGFGLCSIPHQLRCLCLGPYIVVQISMVASDLFCRACLRLLDGQYMSACIV